VFLKIKSLLNPQDISRLVALSRELHFVDGRASNPANVTKNNLQADAADPKFAESSRIVGRRVCALARVRRFRDAQASRAAAFVALRTGHEIWGARRRRNPANRK
jgi:hypothetical protein